MVLSIARKIDPSLHNYRESHVPNMHVKCTHARPPNTHDCRPPQEAAHQHRHQPSSLSSLAECAWRGSLAVPRSKEIHINRISLLYSIRFGAPLWPLPQNRTIAAEHCECVDMSICPARGRRAILAFPPPIRAVPTAQQVAAAQPPQTRTYGIEHTFVAHIHTVQYS